MIGPIIPGGAAGLSETAADALYVRLDDFDTPLGAKLVAVRDLTWAANKGLYFIGTGAVATFDLTSYGRSLGNVADEAAFKSLVNLEIGVDVQAYSAKTAAIAAATWAANSFIYLTGTGTVDVTGLTSGSRTALAGSGSATTWLNGAGALTTPTPGQIGAVKDISAQLASDASIAFTLLTYEDFLTIALEANVTYYVELHLGYTTGATPDGIISADLSAVSGTGVQSTSFQTDGIQVLSSFGTDGGAAVSGTNGVEVVGNAARRDVVWWAIIRTTAAGNLKILFATKSSGTYTLNGRSFVTAVPIA